MRMMRAVPIQLASLAIGLGVLAAARAANAQECASSPGEWLFCDDFESAADADGALGLWDDQGLHPENLLVETDPALVHSGARSLRIPAHMGIDTGGGPTKWFDGQDHVYARFFVRFDEDYEYLHHFVHLLGNRADDPWSGFGMAGCRPAGDNFFSTGIEPTSNWGANPQPGAWNFYTYSVDMECDSA